MRIIDQSYEIIDPEDLHSDVPQILRLIEQAGRTSYKSVQTDDLTNTKQFISRLIERGHESVLEHGGMTVKFITNRGVTHELVRHRLASFTQESTRYCNYSQDRFDNQIMVIKPVGIETGTKLYESWATACEICEWYYLKMLEDGTTPQIARAVLPTCTKAEIVVTANWREWRHILKLRTAQDAHPQMRALMQPLLNELKEWLGCLFDDI